MIALLWAKFVRLTWGLCAIKWIHIVKGCIVDIKYICLYIQSTLGYLEFCEVRSVYLNKKYILSALTKNKDLANAFRLIVSSVHCTVLPWRWRHDAFAIMTLMSWHLHHYDVTIDVVWSDIIIKRCLYFWYNNALVF